MNTKRPFLVCAFLCICGMTGISVQAQPIASQIHQISFETKGWLHTKRAIVFSRGEATVILKHGEKGVESKTTYPFDARRFDAISAKVIQVQFFALPKVIASDASYNVD